MVTDRKKKIKELESQNDSMIEPKSPQYQSMSTTDTGDTVLAPKLTNTLVPTTEEKQKEEQSKIGHRKQFSE